MKKTDQPSEDRERERARKKWIIVLLADYILQSNQFDLIQNLWTMFVFAFYEIEAALQLIDKTKNRNQNTWKTFTAESKCISTPKISGTLLVSLVTIALCWRCGLIFIRVCVCVCFFPHFENIPGAMCTAHLLSNVWLSNKTMSNQQQLVIIIISSTDC